MEIVERTPLERIDEAPLDWIAREGPSLIADILTGIVEHTASGELELPAAGLERLSELGQLRRGDGAPALIPRDLAALQAILIEALRRDVPERGIGSFGRSVERLAEIFGGIQAMVSEDLVNERTEGAPLDELTGLQREIHLHDWLRVLLAEQRRYDHPFALVMIGIEGLKRIREAHGDAAGDRMVAALGTIVRRQIRTVDHAFRLGDDEFCVLAPHQRADAMVVLGDRLCRVVDGAQGPESPRVAIAAGIAGCPDHGDDAESLLSAAEQAMWAANAAGRSAIVSGAGP
jgi:diguanylate cyclase (GGDEF)-like protein